MSCRVVHMFIIDRLFYPSPENRLHGLKLPMFFLVASTCAYKHSGWRADGAFTPQPRRVGKERWEANGRTNCGKFFCISSSILAERFFSARGRCQIRP